MTALGGANRIKYGDQLIQRVCEQLAQEFGRGFDARNLSRMVKFWGMLCRRGNCVDTVGKIELEPHGEHRGAQIPTGPPVLTNHTAQDGWTVRELNQQIDRAPGKCDLARQFMPLALSKFDENPICQQ